MLHTALLALLLAAATPEDQVRQAEKTWAAAVVARDFPALERIFTRELIYAHASGAIESKAEYLGRLKEGRQKYDSIDYESTAVRSYGDAAVTHSKLWMRGTSNGNPFNDHVMMLHLWVRRGGAWQLAAHQTTRLP